MSRVIVYTRFDGGVSICMPAEECLRAMSGGGYWTDMPRGYLDIQIERQIEAGHHPDAARRFARAVHYGGCTTAAALEIIRDRDCGHLGTAHELWDASDVPQDRWFRDAWRRGGNSGSIVIDLTKARAIQFRKIRAAADAEAKRQAAEIDHFDRVIDLPWGAIRDKINAAADEIDLRRIWPEGLHQ